METVNQAKGNDKMVKKHSKPRREGLPTIRKGSQGLSVAYCQNLLNSRLSAERPLWVDGIFGPKTDKKVRQFQRNKGLTADGIVGPLTWSALEAGPPPIKKRPGRGAHVPTAKWPPSRTRA